MAERRSPPTVLVVEEPGIQRVVASILERFGYIVIDADTRHALDLLTQVKPDLLITNSPLPFLELGCDMRILYIAGVPDRSLLERSSGSLGILQKPFTHLELLSAVRERLTR